MRQVNYKTALIIIGVLIVTLAFVIIRNHPMYISFFSTSLFTAAVMYKQKIPFSNLSEKVVYDIKRMLPVMYVLASIGMMIAAWMYCGTLAACMDLGLMILPKFNLLLSSFLLTMILSMLLGTAVGTIGTLGTMLMILGSTMSIPLPMVAGAIISGSYFGDRTSPMSSSANLTASMSGVTLQNHVKMLFKTSYIPIIISAIFYYFLGAKYIADRETLAIIARERLLLQQSFNLQLYHFIPILVLLGLIIIAKRGIIFSVLASLTASMLLVILERGDGIAFVKAALFGYLPSNPEIANIFSGSGFISMVSIFIVLTSASILNSFFSHVGLFNPLFTRYDKLLNTDKRLIFGAGFASNVVMLLTGNQSLPAIVATDRYAKRFDENNIDRKWLSQAISDYMLILVAVPPWNINAVLVFSIIGITSIEYVPYAILPLIMPLTSLLYMQFAYKTAHGKQQF